MGAMEAAPPDYIERAQFVENELVTMSWKGSPFKHSSEMTLPLAKSTFARSSVDG